MILRDLIEIDTYYQVRKAAPQVPVLPVHTAMLCLRVMAKHSLPQNQRIDVDMQPFWHLSYDAIRQQLPVDITNKQIGSLLRGMGLMVWRFSSGYAVFWNRTQLDILMQRFPTEGDRA